MLSADDWAALWLTLHIAGLSTFILLILGIPAAWWLSVTRSRWQGVVSAVIAMPLILPPSVLGFYLLLLLGPKGVVGQLTVALGMGTLPFTFGGIVLASVIYSLPFVVQPLQIAFTGIGRHPLEAAATLRASPVDSFFSVVLPLAKKDILAAGILGFAHTVGEFGVVLMVGGNIPGKTRVVSVQIYNHVESLEYARAHWLAGGLLVFSFCVLLILNTLLKMQPAAQVRK